MISYEDLVYNPEEYQPIGSVKAVKNKPCKMQFDEVDLETMFYEFENEQKLINNLFKIHRQNGGRSTINKFHQLVPKLMTQFGKENIISLYQVADDSATGNQNWVAALDAVNYDFIKYCYKLFKWNHFVPSREYAEVGDNENRKNMRFIDMLAHDIPTIDVWREQKIQIENKHFRDNNKIPVWRKSLHTRHYDRDDSNVYDEDADNNGYKYNKAQSSLENQIHGYDMAPIHDVLNTYKSDGWFGL